MRTEQSVYDNPYVIQFQAQEYSSNLSTKPGVPLYRLVKNLVKKT